MKSAIARRAAACAFGIALASALPGYGGAQTAGLATDCSLVDAAEAGRIIGFPLQDADDSSRAGGICFFPSRDVSDEGALSYAVVTASQLPARRAFFRVIARRCAGVDSQAPNAPLCASYARLAEAGDLDAYFAAQRTVPDASPLPALGSAAVANATAVYVRVPGAVIEALVRRGGDLDVVRSSELAALVAKRLRDRP